MTSHPQPHHLTASRAIVISEIAAMGGAERCCLALSRWLHNQGLKHHIVTYRDTLGLARLASHPVEIVELAPHMDPRSKVNALRRHFQQIASPYQPLMSGYQPALHATLAGIRGFHTLMHDTPSLLSDAAKPPSLRRSVVRFMSNRIVAQGLRSGGKTFVNSQFLRNDTWQTFAVEAVILPMGGPMLTQEFRPRQWNGTLNMISVSRLSANKRIDWIIRALTALELSQDPISRHTDWRFDIVGTGSQTAELAELIHSTGMEHRIHLRGFLPDQELANLLENANLMLIPARQGYGIPAIEALQSGIPVLIHRDSGVSDLLLETPWATVVDNTEGNLLTGLQRAINSLQNCSHLDAPLPVFNTEDQWAARIAELCRWL